jgi:hypothetical protein
MEKTTKYHGSVLSKNFFSYHSSTEVTVLSSVTGPACDPEPAVHLQIHSGGAMFSVSLRPTAARQLVALLIKAADEAERPDTEPAAAVEDPIERARRVA